MSAPVSFEATLMALGADDSIADVGIEEGEASLVFVAPVEEVRKAAVLFKSKVRLSTASAHGDLLEAAERLVEHFGACIPPELLAEFREAIAKTKAGGR